MPFPSYFHGNELLNNPNLRCISTIELNLSSSVIRTHLRDFYVKRGLTIYIYTYKSILALHGTTEWIVYPAQFAPFAHQAPKLCSARYRLSPLACCPPERNARQMETLSEA